MIIFRLGEALERYRVTGTQLAKELGVSNSAVSEWRVGNATPSLNRLNKIMSALHKLADKEQLQRFPLTVSDMLHWTLDS
ncbi:MAG: helix-turn-helix transcriptional regulator [Phormidesmis sp.]